jgi:hypothetical protein
MFVIFSDFLDFCFQMLKKRNADNISKEEEKKVLLSPDMDTEALMAWITGNTKDNEQQKEKKKPRKATSDYSEDIQKMLHSFGDSAYPLHQTAELLEEASKKYTKKLLNSVAEILHPKTKKKGKRSLKISDNKNKITLESIKQAVGDSKGRVDSIVNFLRYDR